MIIHKRILLQASFGSASHVWASIVSTWKGSLHTWRVFESLVAHVTWYLFCFLLLSRRATVHFCTVLVKALERRKGLWALGAALLLPRREGTDFLMLYQTALKVKRLFAPLAAVRHRDSLSSAFCFGVVSIIIILRVCSRSFLLNLRFSRIWQWPCLEYGYNVKVSIHQIVSKVMPNSHITWTAISKHWKVLHPYVWGLSAVGSSAGWQTAAGTVNWQTLSHDSKLSPQSDELTPAHHRLSDSSGETGNHKSNVI